MRPIGILIIATDVLLHIGREIFPNISARPGVGCSPTAAENMLGNIRYLTQAFTLHSIFRADLINENPWFFNYLPLRLLPLSEFGTLAAYGKGERSTTLNGMETGRNAIHVKAEIVRSFQRGKGAVRRLQ